MILKNPISATENVSFLRGAPPLSQHTCPVSSSRKSRLNQRKLTQPVVIRSQQAHNEDLVTDISEMSSTNFDKKFKHSRRNLITIGASTALSAFCSSCSLLHPAAARADEWEYGSLSGPSQWGGFCATGLRQSPIDIPTNISDLPTTTDLGKLEFQYLPVSPSFYNTGHGTMQVDFPQGTNRLIIGDRELELLQYHFHAPSEHSFGGRKAPMEAHLVHRDAYGRLAVIGVMIQAEPRAPRNACLQAALEFAPKQSSQRSPAPVSCFFSVDPEQPLCPSLVINPGFLLPKPDSDGKFRYLNYDGSLTTPPCSEGVDWYMLTNPVKVPGQQVIEFMQYVGNGYTFSMNSRPIQPLNDRVIRLGP